MKLQKKLSLRYTLLHCPPFIHFFVISLPHLRPFSPPFLPLLSSVPRNVFSTHFLSLVYLFSSLSLSLSFSSLHLFYITSHSHPHQCFLVVQSHLFSAVLFSRFCWSFLFQSPLPGALLLSTFSLPFIVLFVNSPLLGK